MSILLHYYKIYEEEIKENGGILEPEEVKIATSKYKADNDRFNEYITENIREDISAFETLRVIYSNFIKWWSDNYTNSKTPDIKELRKSLKIKYGDEIERIANGSKQIGFNIKLKHNEYDIIDEDTI